MLAAVILPLASMVSVGIPKEDPYVAAVTPELARVNVPVESIVASPPIGFMLYPVPVPMTSVPLGAVYPSIPMPPLATPSIPVVFATVDKSIALVLNTCVAPTRDR